LILFSVSNLGEAGVFTLARTSNGKMHVSLLSNNAKAGKRFETLIV